MNKLLDSLHKKILNHKFAEVVSEEEIWELVKAKERDDGWIPCSSEPTEEGSYIVAWIPEHLEVRCDSPHYYGIFEFENGEWSIDVPDGYKNIGIVMLAYRLLPQPYQPKGE